MPLEDGELPQSNDEHDHEANFAPKQQQIAMYVAEVPQKKICRGICRSSEPEPSNFKLSDFDKVEKIGEGTFGKVYRAEFKLPDGSVKLYALKKLNMVLDES